MDWHKGCAVVGMVLCLGWGVRLQAQHGSGAAQDVDRGIQLYLDGRYREAIQSLERAAGDEDLEENKRIGALQHLAFCQIALGEETAARETFRNLLGLHPAHRLPAGTSPKILRVFEAVQREEEARRPPPPPAAPLATAEPQAPPAIDPAKLPAPPEKEPASRSGSNWWIWGIVGAVLVGAGVAVAVSLSGDDQPTGRANITIRVEP